jgi:hypothetical protein
MMDKIVPLTAAGMMLFCRLLSYNRFRRYRDIPLVIIGCAGLGPEQAMMNDVMAVVDTGSAEYDVILIRNGDSRDD